MIKLIIIFFWSGIFLQVTTPVVVEKRPIISDGLWQTFITVVGLVVVAYLNNRKSDKDKAEIKAEVKTMEINLDDKVSQLTLQTDGKLTDLLEISKEVSRRIGIEEGIKQSKDAHEAQSEKDKEANIAKGKIEGLAEAKSGQQQSNTLLPNQAEPIKVVLSHEEPVKVQIDQPEDNPTPVTVVEKPKDIH